MNDRDMEILKLIIRYADELEAGMKVHNVTYNTFLSDPFIKNSISMSVFQITELTGKLSEECKKKHNKLPWISIKGMRNRFAHGYEGMDIDFIWEAATEDVPKLRAYCDKILKDEKYE